MTTRLAAGERTGWPRAQLRLVVALTVLLVSGPTWGHDFSLTDTVLIVRADGRYQVDLVVDLDALALGLPSGNGGEGHSAEEVAERLQALSLEQLRAAEVSLSRLFERRVRMRFDGQPVRHDVSFPDARWRDPSEPLGVDEEPESPTTFGVTARLSGQVPPGALTVSFFASRAFQNVHLTVLQQRAEVVERVVLQPGEESPAFPLAGSRAEGRGSNSGDSSDIEEDDVDRRPRWSVLASLVRFARLGFVHIVPRGLDHVLFVFALCLVGSNWRVLALWVSFFTLGHTVSLILSSLGLMSADPRLVEPLIALSIGWVAWRALRADRERRIRPAAGVMDVPYTGPEARSSELLVVSSLGLLHGFGFARILFEVGLERAGFISALAGFNLGVELGQLVVLLFSTLALFWVRRWLGPRWAVRPWAYLLMAISLFWTVERLGLV